MGDWLPVTVYVALPSMLRETLTLHRDVTVGKVKETIEFLTSIKVQEQHLFHSAVDGFYELQDDAKTLRDLGFLNFTTLVLYVLKNEVCEELQTDAPSTSHRATQTLFTAYEDPSEGASGASIPGASIPGASIPFALAK